MLWNKGQQKDGLPDLPQKSTTNQVVSPPDKDFDEGDESVGVSHALPSFPDSPMHNTFSQAAIKDAVSAGSYDDRNQIVGPTDASGENRPVKVMEVEGGWSSSQKPSLDNDIPSRYVPKAQVRQPLVSPPPSSLIPEVPAPIQSSGKKVQATSSDVFVKIDKFHSAKRAIKETSLKLGEIDELIKKIRDVKMREEQELTNWEKEMGHIKARMQDIMDNLFEKVD